MFHVKLIFKKLTIVGLSCVFVILSLSCVGARATIQIPDYLLAPNGKELLGGKALTAFIFENNVKGVQLEEYLSVKFMTNNIQQREIWTTIEGQKFLLIIYDNVEFEKYFDSSNYSPLILETKNDRYSQVKFLAISVVNSSNENCLADGSLYQNMVVNYLRNLKDEYRSNGNR